jgi:uncharacterized protein YggU (UPF0235/DUF167 family)
MEAVKLALTHEGGVSFEVQARPRARSSRIAAVRAGALVVQLAAIPADGAANEELVATLARALSLPRRQVLLMRGAASRAKRVQVLGLGIDDVRQRLMTAIG